MNPGDKPHRRPGRLLAIAITLAALAILALLGAWALLRSHVVVAPPRPIGEVAEFHVPSTSSRLSVAVTLPTSALAAHLDAVLPKTFPFDATTDGVRVYGEPGRGAVSVASDAAARQASASTPVAGRVQVERRLPFLGTTTVGIDVTGEVRASIAPVVAADWAIDPRLSLSARVDKAVARTVLGELDVTGQVQGSVSEVVRGERAKIDARMKSVLDVRDKVERLWNELNTVHKLSEEPPSWLRITPRAATFGGLTYAADSIDSGLSVILEMSVHVQESAPKALASPFPDLTLNAAPAGEVELLIPVEIPYSALNRELRSRLPKSPIELPRGATIEITDAMLASYGSGVLLTVDFAGRHGWLKSASGRLYVRGNPVFDASKMELRVDDLDYSVETKSLLVSAADWLGHEMLLDAMKGAAVLRLDGELAKARTKATDALEELKRKLPAAVGANVAISSLTIDRLTFARERVFAVVSAKGTMSARLRP